MSIITKKTIRKLEKMTKEEILDFLRKSVNDLSKHNKEYYAKNKTKILSKVKEYQKTHPVKFVHTPERNMKFNCDCGGKYTKSNKTTHEKTKKHKKWLEDEKLK